MWIASQLGFFSIVSKEDCFHVRARTSEDLQRLKLAADLNQEIERWPNADYRFRLRVPAAELARIFAALERSISYSNFKSRIAALPHQGNKLAAYERLWFDLLQLQDADTPRQRHDHARAGQHH